MIIYLYKTALKWPRKQILIFSSSLERPKKEEDQTTLNEAHHERALRPSRCRKDSKTTARKQNNEDGTNLNDLSQARALRPSRHQKDSKATARKQTNDGVSKVNDQTGRTVAMEEHEDEHLNEAHHQPRALRPSRRQKEKESKTTVSNEANAKPRGRLFPRHFWKKRSDKPSNDSNADVDLRNTNWRRYRQENESAEDDIIRPGAVRVPGDYGIGSDNEVDQDEDEESVTQPGAVRMPGDREELDNDDNTIAIGTINGDDQSYTNRNTSNPMTRENQTVMNASAPTANGTPANKTATETTGGRRICICLCVLVLVVGAAVGVALGLTGGGDDDVLTVAPTDSPTQPPTLFVVPACSGFEWIDPDIESMDEQTLARYSELLLTLIKLVPDYLEPTEAQEYCSAAHLALVWLTNDDLDYGYSQKVLESRFLLAFLHVEWRGYNWLGNTTGWLSESPECDWYGISCDVLGSIHELDVSYQIDNRELTDPLTMPSEIGLFTDLRSLKVAGNGLGGSIPSSFGNLVNLEILDLKKNRNLMGTFLFSSLPLNMRGLRLSGSDLEVNIPTTIAQWSMLEYLVIAGCNVQGEIPTEIGNLTNLAVLSLFGSGIEGQIPTEIGNMNNLQYADFGRNNLGGPLPTEIGLLSNLKWLYLPGNALLSGSLPTEIGNLSMLERLVIDESFDVSGTIPTEMGRCTALEILILSETSIGGPLPSELGLLPNIKTLDFSGSVFEGTVPSSVLSLSSLESFSVANTYLTGAITANLTELPSLDCLDIRGVSDRSATLISETCDKSYDSSIQTNSACPYMLFSDCECCSTCGPLSQAILLFGCAFGFGLNQETAVIAGVIFEEFFKL